MDDVVGRVALWGRVVEHELGYRAERAYPLGLTLVHAHLASPIDQKRVRALERAYNVPAACPSGEEIRPSEDAEAARAVLLRRRAVAPRHALLAEEARRLFDRGSRGDALALVLERARRIDFGAIVGNVRGIDPETAELDGGAFLHVDRVRTRAARAVSGPRGRQVVEVRGSYGGWPQGWTGSQHVVLDTVSGAVHEELLGQARHLLSPVPWHLGRYRAWCLRPLRVRSSLAVTLEAWLQLIEWSDPPVFIDCQRHEPRGCGSTCPGRPGPRFGQRHEHGRWALRADGCRPPRTKRREATS